MPLPKIYSQITLSKLLGISKGYLYAVSMESSYFYRHFTLRKKTRGKRQIHAPVRALKGIQRWILNEILIRLSINQCAKGFVKGRSIVDNAQIHANKKYILNIDIKDFFPSIHGVDVYRVFLDQFSYKPLVSTLLANLTTYNDCLPQGAPTSPYLSNIVCQKMDLRIEAYCSKNGFGYTRYADDITVSGDVRLDSALRVLRVILSEYGFEINTRKTRFAHAGQRMMVTGLTVNKKVSIPRSQRKVYRAMFHQAKISPIKFKSKFNQLSGYYSFLKMVSPGLKCLGDYKATLAVLSES